MNALEDRGQRVVAVNEVGATGAVKDNEVTNFGNEKGGA